MNGVRVVRMVNSRRVHTIDEPVPFRTQRSPHCIPGGPCRGHQDCSNTACGAHPLNSHASKVDSKLRAWFWRFYLGGLAVVAAALLLVDWA
jgi:hypothetical protein